jgi:sulfate transport system substrate-binding protein
VKDWNDLTRDGVKVITPNPKTSGGARWNYLAAYAYALRQNGGDEQKAREFVSKLYSNVPVLDAGARGSTITFTERRMGDVFLSWENEAHLIQKQYPGQYEIITPSLSILAEPPVALVDKVVDRKGTREVAQAYLEFLYTPEAQDIIGRHYYRPRDAAAAAKFSAKFPKIDLVTIEDFGGWRKAQKDHFNDGGVFDRIYKPYRP